MPFPSAWGCVVATPVSGFFSCSLAIRVLLAELPQSLQVFLELGAARGPVRATGRAEKIAVPDRPARLAHRVPVRHRHEAEEERARALGEEDFGHRQLARGSRRGRMRWISWPAGGMQPWW